MIDINEAVTRLDNDIAFLRATKEVVHYYREDKDRLANDIESMLDEISRYDALLKSSDLDVEEYISNIEWSNDIDDYIKTLVAGNIRGFASRQRNDILNKLKQE